MIREKWLTAGAVAAIPGVDLLDDIDRVLISSPGKNSSDDSAESPILIAIHGHFDAAKVRQVFTHLGAKPQAYNSFQVYRPQGKDRGAATPRTQRGFCSTLRPFCMETRRRSSPRSIAINLRKLRRSQRSSARIHRWLARAEMDANYELWMIMDATEMMSSDRIAALFRGGEWASEAQALEAGFNLRTGLVADITVHFSSDSVAKRVTAELTRAMNLAAKDKSAGAQVQNIAKKMKFNVDGSAAKVSLRLSEQELEESALAFAASQKAAAADAVLSESLNATPVAAPVTTPPQRAVIRIEGLDEGTREIPYHEPPIAPAPPAQVR